MQVIPFGDRILVKRQQVGTTAGKDSLIHLPETTATRPTDLATVVYIPEHSFADKQLIEESESIVGSLTNKAKDGDSDALIALLRYNEFLKIKSIAVGDKVFISKYVGTDFHDNKGGESLTLVKGDDVIGIVRDE